MLVKLKAQLDSLKKNIQILYLCCKSPKTPWYAKVIAILTVAYAISPIDLIPDFIPIIGYLDDLLILPLGIILSIKLIPKEVFNECKASLVEPFKITKTLKLISILMILLFWLLIIYFCLKLLTK